MFMGPPAGHGEGNGTPFQYSCLANPMDGGAWWAAVHGVTRSWTRLSNFTFTFHFHALEKEMATHSSVLAWRITGMGEPGGLPSMGSHRVRYDWSDLAVAAVGHISWAIKYYWSEIIRKVWVETKETWRSSQSIDWTDMYKRNCLGIAKNMRGELKETWRMYLESKN